MKNTTCIICHTPFDEPREGKLYCSETCKQTAYRNKKKEEEITQIQLKEVEKPLFVFDIQEYNKFKEQSGLKDIDLEYYCFFRRCLIGKPNINEIIDYFKLRNDVFDFQNKIDVDEYNKFKMLFNGGAYAFINVKPTDN